MNPWIIIAKWVLTVITFVILVDVGMSVVLALILELVVTLIQALVALFLHEWRDRSWGLRIFWKTGMPSTQRKVDWS